MAYNAVEHTGTAGGHAPSSLVDSGATTAQNIVISPVGMSDIPIPGQGFITHAIMTQEGSDLLLETPDGVTIVIEDYFSADPPPNLVSPDGKVLTPALVKSFIQADSNFAEGSTSMADATPIGEVDEVAGQATVTRMDGSREAIVKGTDIYEGDVIETDAKGAVNIAFADESSFAVSSNAKMAIDSFVYDPASHGGENKFSILRGLFVYTSGLIGREDPDDVQINTPVGSIGIRGTIITGFIPGEDSPDPARISVVEGAIVVRGLNGTDVTLSQQFETVQIDTANGTMTNVGMMPQGDMIETFNVLRAVAPTLFSAMDEARQETTPATDQPAPGEAPPAVETQPQLPDAPAQEMDYKAPPANDIIRLNLLQDSLETNVLSAPLTSQDIKINTATAAIAPSDTIAPPVSHTIAVSPSPAPAPAPLPYNPPPAAAGDSGGSSGPPPVVDLAPVAKLGSYIAFEQEGLAGEAHHFNISRFFSDPENGSLTYAISGVSDPNGALIGKSVSASGELSFTVSGGLAGAESVTLNISASDGVNSSPSITFTLNLNPTAGSAGPYGAGDDFDSVLSSGNAFTTGSGMDEIYIETGNSSNLVFSGADDDTIEIRSDNNKVFTEDGNDTIRIYSANGNTVSGGAGDDDILVDTNQFRLYGGTGNDTITLMSGFDGTSLVDGGSGFDTLVLGSGVSLNLGSIGTLTDIEKIKLANTGSESITLDLTDILEHTSGKSLYIDVDGTDNVTVTNTSGMPGLVQQAGTVSDGTGENYNIYTNGSVTLYVSADAGTAGGAIAGL